MIKDITACFFKHLALSEHSGVLVPTQLDYWSFLPQQHVLNFREIKLTFKENCSAGFPPVP